MQLSGTSSHQRSWFIFKLENNIRLTGEYPANGQRGFYCSV